MSVNGDAMNYTRSLGERLNYFLYEGRPSKNVKKERMLEECLELLQSIRDDAWESYDDYRSQLGYK